MSERNMKKQHGVTLIGLIFICVLIIMVALVGMKVVPDVIEYYSIVNNVKAVATDPASKEASVMEIRRSFSRRSDIDNIKAIQANDLEITKENGEVMIGFAYSSKIHLFGPVSLVLDFEGSSAQ